MNDTPLAGPSEVYILQCDVDHVARLTLDRLDDLDRLAPFDGMPLGASWEVLPMHWDTEGGRRPLADVSDLGHGGWAFSPRALGALGDLLNGRGELLPLGIAGGVGGWQAFNVTRLSDALDEGHSRIEYFKGLAEILDIERYAFDPSRLVPETVFKLRQDPAPYEYVTDEFRRRVEQARLSGFLWDRRVWAVDARSGAA